ncbi:MAG: Uma2 family endonuclease [Cytophagales bacterium]|nr:MAG: Uma2 family endonuclease [Cytophagales bacterium]
MQTLVSETELLAKYIDAVTGEIIYPSSDGNRMAETTEHFEQITTIEGNLESLFAHKTDVFVAGDLLWYPEKSKPYICVASDTMVAFGRPKGHRDSYKQWEEENIAPAVVFEILSKTNGVTEMLDKLLFYQKYGVEEYYLYDPIKLRFHAWNRKNDRLDSILVMPIFESPLLGVKFEIYEGSKLKIFNPDGSQFLTFVEQSAKRKQAEQALKKAEELAKIAKQEKAEAEEFAKKAEEEKAKAEEEKAKAEETLESEKAKVQEIKEVLEEEKARAEKAELEYELLKKLLKEQGFNLSDI